MPSIAVTDTKSSAPAGKGDFQREAPPADPRAAQLAKIHALLQTTILLTAVILSIWLLGPVLMVVFAATLLAVILHNLAALAQRRIRLPYWLALTLVVVILLAAFAGLIWSSGPTIAEQATRLRVALTTQAYTVRGQLGASEIGRTLLDYLPQTLGGNQPGGGSDGMGSRIAGSMTGVLSSAFGAVGTLAVILIAGLYFALSPTLYVNGLLRLFPTKHRPAARTLLLVAGRTLWAWTAGQALDMFVVGMLSAIGLWFVGVPLALALGVVAGLANFIPYIGAFIGAVPAILLGLSVGTREGLMVLALYTAIQFFEGNVMAPLIQRHAVQMPPGVTILSQTVFGTILGLPGLILASPLTAALLAVMDRASPPLDESDRV
ncbi:transporter [Gluconacetobacter sacchari DSM 12717]|uniref:AI-2E family transporter n=2 Tax=Gluconacetobacter sacchari TaxID=92759 RepID=A0A7W4IEZ1_9PROT|nr:AI-2E family transporter [Gluconacetobacter sacchari]MBB2161507.1 AI-2E family transporter [Gluconacetobacter sacchari]GBQ30874.1 transporter [Gluconacetobacter sacchari DSM 12717]